MRNIWAVFTADIKSLSRCFFATAVAVSITVLPSLYAWLNIYSNWDPYGNTGNISIAVYSGDKGCIEGGRYVNKGRDIVDDLRESAAINCVICDTEEQDVNGVYSGDYYAAVTIDDDFSYKMFNMLTEWTGKPSLTYYENAKKNAVATKITDTAVDSLRRTVDRAYLEVVVEAIVKQTNEISAELADGDAENSIASILSGTRSLLSSCVETMDAFAAASDGSSGRIPTLDPVKLEEIVNKINSVRFPDGTGPTVTELDVKLYQALELASQSIEQAQQKLSGLTPVTGIGPDADAAAKAMGEVGDILDGWADYMQETGFDAAGTQTIRDTAELCFSLQTYLLQLPDGSDLTATIDRSLDTINDILGLAGEIIPTAQGLRQDINNMLGQASQTLSLMRGMVNDAAMLTQAANATLHSLQEAMDVARPMIRQVGANLAEKVRLLASLDGEEYLDLLIDTLGASPEVYSEYFSEMVQTSVHKVYTVDNYGSAMAPFYTVLAIWVGCVILVAIIKPHARTEGLVNPRPAELFFGRYIFFFILSQLQTAIIITGDLYILKIQCMHPALLYLTGFFTSFTFSMLIYALTYSFGDVGKAVVVIIMVLQIAGSSGTFPVELLPEFNRRIYILFPFPYAIDMMRECICGLYGRVYLVKTALLSIFAGIGLVVGLLISKPFAGLNRFMEERLEETGLF